MKDKDKTLKQLLEEKGIFLTKERMQNGARMLINDKGGKLGFYTHERAWRELIHNKN